MKNKIVSVVWERANLYIEFENKIKIATIFNNENKYNLKVKDNKIIIPFYNIKDGEILKDGIYKIKIPLTVNYQLSIKKANG